MAQIHIALAGNPNCGKTTLFNEITGSNGYVGNWPGVTVEKKEALYRKNKSVTITDLPGIYSLSPYSPEEIVSRDYLIDARPEAVIDLVDATNLERNLYLTTQVLECGLPVVVGLNMCDLLKKRGDMIDTEKLSEMLGAEVVSISALRNENVDELLDKAQAAAGSKPAAAPHLFSKDVEDALTQIAELIKDTCDESHLRWYTIKAFERDESGIASLNLSDEVKAQIETFIAGVEAAYDDDAESIITSERYEWIATLIDACVTKAPAKLTTTEKIDSIVTNRILGLPIFVVVMSLVYWLSVSSVGYGTHATDFVNDGIFGDGFFADDLPGFIFTGEGAHASAFEEASEEYQLKNYQSQIDAYIEAAEAKGVDVEGVKEAVSAEEKTPEDEARITAFEEAASAAHVEVKDLPIKDANDNFVDTKGEPVRTVIKDGEQVPELESGQELMTVNVDAAGFEEALNAEEPDPASFGHWVNGIPGQVTSLMEGAGASPLLVSLVVDGIIAGVGAVLGFLPQMIVLFMFLTFLEDCGYMSRVAFVMDRIFRKFGLSGKSFIPMLISAGCAVPGVMSTKTIENEADRRMTIMTVPFVPCSAKLPIIALLMGILVGGSSAWWVAPMFYFMGVAAVIISGIMLKKTTTFAGDPTPFIMELPAYHIPRFKSWLLHVWERARAFVVKAGTIIFIASIVVWFLSNFGFANWEGGNGAFGYLPELPAVPEDFIDFSVLAILGNSIKWLFAPLGFDNWKAVAATISGLVAKENLVSTYAVLYGLGELSEDATVLWSLVNNEFTVNGIVNIGGIVAFMAFNMLCAPCFAAMGAMRKQLDNRKWWLLAIAYETCFAWVIALFINQFYQLIVFHVFGIWTIIAAVALAVVLWQLFRPMPKDSQ